MSGSLRLGVNYPTLVRNNGHLPVAKKGMQVTDSCTPFFISNIRMKKIFSREVSLAFKIITKRPRTLEMVLLSMLLALPAMGQKDKNYYTQVVHLTDGTVIRLLPDNISRMGIIKADDYGHMTVGEYLLYSPLKLDSAYSMVGFDTNDENLTYNLWVPTNDAWVSAMTALRPYFFTPEKVVGLDIDNMAESNVKRTVYCNGGINNTYAYGILANLCKSTTAPDGVVATQQVMNGTVTVVDGEVPRSYWLHDLTVNDWSTAATKSFRSVDSVATAPGGNQYAMFSPAGNYVKPDVFVKLPKALSTTYDFYCVLVPENGDICDTVTTARPNILNFELYYGDASGALQTYKFASGADYGANALKNAFTNNPAAIDTLHIGQFTFPVAYEDMDYYHEDEVAPVLCITCPISVFNKAQYATYTRTLRLAAIIMRPIEPQND